MSTSHDIGQIRIQNMNVSPSSYDPRNFEIQIGFDGTNWTTVYTGISVVWAPLKIKNFVFPTILVLYVRLYVTLGGRINAMQVYGAVPGPNIYFNTSKVGIGNNLPIHSLNVTDNINFTGNLLKNGNPLTSNPSYSSINLNGPINITEVNGTYQDTSLQINLSHVGTFFVSCFVRTYMNFASGNIGYMSGKLYNSTLNSTVPNTETILILSSNSNIDIENTTTINQIITISRSENINL
jgi:hypothetical protein